MGPDGSPHGYMRRHCRIGDWVPVEVNVIPCQRPGLFGADPRQQAQHHMGTQARPFGGG